MHFKQIFLVLPVLIIVSCKNRAKLRPYSNKNCGMWTLRPQLNGDFGNIRKGAMNCRYILGSREVSQYSTVTFTLVDLNDADIFVVYIGNIKHGPYYGNVKPFSLTTNNIIYVNLTLLDDEVNGEKVIPKFRGYVKTFKINHNNTITDNSQTIPEPPFCYKRKNVFRLKRSENDSCRFVILFDIFQWSKQNLLIEKCQEWQVIPKDNEIPCVGRYCSGNLQLRHDKRSIDKQKWVCRSTLQPSSQKHRNCGYSQSLRTKSLFAKSKLQIYQIVSFVNLWVRNVMLKVIAEQTKMSYKTAVAWSSFCRQIVYDAMIIRNEQIGGPGVEVEIDESKFGKRKDNRGHQVKGTWVFGGYERGTGKVFMEVVDNREETTLLALIKKWIKPKTRILSDENSSYRNLSLYDYEHQTVNHDDYFKDPVTGVHINAIESTWGHAKCSVTSKCYRKAFLGGYLARYMFIKHAKAINADPMVLFFQYSRRLYDSIGQEVDSVESFQDECETDEEECTDD